MKFKPTRKLLLGIAVALGIILILYALVAEFLHLKLPEKMERYFMDVIVFGALAIFMYNRKLAGDEKKAREAAEAAAQAAVEQESEPESDDENRPHWERDR
ncbi:MAG: hypothetical protein LBB82_08600 [Treponema sp.]|jgi:putative Ca2+/H+ antiporter (TMEM165/GDT1 family)|nr:hypothetical protein [Treponema sp.]